MQATAGTLRWRESKIGLPILSNGDPFRPLVVELFAYKRWVNRPNRPRSTAKSTLTKLTFFVRNTFTFLLGPRVFSHTFGCVACKEPAYAPRRQCEPRPRSVGRALGLPYRKFWQITTGSHSDLLKPSRTMDTPHISRFLSAAGCLLLLYHV